MRVRRAGLGAAGGGGAGKGGCQKGSRRGTTASRHCEGALNDRGTTEATSPSVWNRSCELGGNRTQVFRALLPRTGHATLCPPPLPQGQSPQNARRSPPNPREQRSPKMSPGGGGHAQRPKPDHFPLQLDRDQRKNSLSRRVPSGQGTVPLRRGDCAKAGAVHRGQGGGARGHHRS